MVKAKTKTGRFIKRTVAIVAGVGAAGAIYANRDTIGDLFTPSPAAVEHAEDRELVEKTAKASRDFWKAHGIGSAASTKVVIVEGGPEYDYHCQETTAPEKITHSYDADLGFCAITNTAVIPAGAINDLRNNNSKNKLDGDRAITGWVRFAAAGVVDIDHSELTDNAPTNEKQASAAAEYRKACLAGVETAKTKDFLDDTQAIYQSFKHSSDTEYGGDHNLIALNYTLGAETQVKLTPVNVNICADPNMGGK